VIETDIKPDQMTASDRNKTFDPLRATNWVPATVNSTVRTSPAGPSGVSAGQRVIRSICESGSSET
jgi:hypothetical protein